MTIIGLCHRKMQLKENYDLIENGYAVIPFPQYIKDIIKSNILEKIAIKTNSNLNINSSIEEITKAVCSMDENAFRISFSKPERNLSGSAVDSIVKYVRNIAKSLGGKISDINYLSPREIKSNECFNERTYDLPWRCVRPNKIDVGAAHADYQFWDINDNTDLDPLCPIDYDQRWKVWVPLFGCNNSNSIQFISGSHKEEVPFIIRENDGSIKPDIDHDWLDSNESKFICPFDSFDENCVIFHDRLIHRGPKNLCNHIRISNEFTILLKI